MGLDVVKAVLSNRRQVVAPDTPKPDAQLVQQRGLLPSIAVKELSYQGNPQRTSSLRNRERRHGSAPHAFRRLQGLKRGVVVVQVPLHELDDDSLTPVLDSVGSTLLLALRKRDEDCRILYSRQAGDALRAKRDFRKRCMQVISPPRIC